MATFKEYKKKDGTTLWLFQAYLGVDPLTGKEVRTTRRNFKTKKEAQLALARLQVDYEKAGLNKAGCESFKEVYELWLETYRTTVKEVTLIKTEIKFKRWILPIYGDMKINKVSTKNAQRIINQWAKETDQYRVLHSSASRIFKYAINLGIIESNPLSNVMMPSRAKEKVKDETIKVYTRDQLKALFDYVNHCPATYTDDYNKTLLRFLVYSGCRISEALALDWADIDFQEGAISINKTLSDVNRGVKVTAPKTEKSIGVLPMDAKTMAVLKRWQVNQKIYMLETGVTNPTKPFCDIDKTLITHNTFYLRMKKISKNAGIPFLGNHVTRHTHASLLLDAGANMKEVQERLRHSSITVTMDIYGHLSKETKKNTVEKFVNHLSM